MQINAPLDDDLQTNVLISDDGSPQVTDICCSFTSLPGTEITSAILCAPRWTAPERLNDGGEANAKGDVWAFGMTALVRSTIISLTLGLSMTTFPGAAYQEITIQ